MIKYFYPNLCSQLPLRPFPMRTHIPWHAMKHKSSGIRNSSIHCSPPQTKVDTATVQWEMVRGMFPAFLDSKGLCSCMLYGKGPSVTHRMPESV